MIGTQLRDQGALGEVLVFGDRAWFKCAAVEIAAQNESAIVLDIVQAKRKKACLALK